MIWELLTMKVMIISAPRALLCLGKRVVNPPCLLKLLIKTYSRKGIESLWRGIDVSSFHSEIG